MRLSLCLKATACLVMRFVFSLFVYTYIDSQANIVTITSGKI